MDQMGTHQAMKNELTAWQQLGDAAADFALKIQATRGAPKRFVNEALKLIDMHRDLRPEQYGPRVPMADPKIANAFRDAKKKGELQ